MNETRGLFARLIRHFGFLCLLYFYCSDLIKWDARAVYRHHSHVINLLLTTATMARSTAGYQALGQSEDYASDEDTAADDVQIQQPPSRGIQRANRPGNIDLHKLDTAFKRYVFSLSIY